MGASVQQEMGDFSLGELVSIQVCQQRFLNFVRRTDSLQGATPCEAAICCHLLTSPYATMPIIEPKKSFLVKDYP